jgi:hypothetical protein
MHRSSYSFFRTRSLSLRSEPRAGAMDLARVLIDRFAREEITSLRRSS